MRFNTGSKSPLILQLHGEGFGVRAIARHAGCSPGNVVRVLRRYMQWTGRVEPLPAPAHQWLVAEAERARTTPEVMARAMLIDAINEAMEKSE